LTIPVDDGQDRDSTHDYRNSPGIRLRPRPEVCNVTGERIADGGQGGETGQQHHPADLETHEIAEGRARVKIWPSGPVEQRANFGEAQHN
jgi:hypothetical protein